MKRARAVLVVAAAGASAAALVACHLYAYGERPGIDGGIVGTVVVAGGDDASLDGGEAGTDCALTPCAVSLAIGGDHGCLIATDGVPWCWGSAASGELGTGAWDGGATVDPAAQSKPAPVPGVSAVHVVAAGGVPSGPGFTCADVGDAGVGCWGGNASQQLARGSSDAGALDPAYAPSGFTSTSLALGAVHGCALVKGGDVACWGDGASAELGRALPAGATNDGHPALVPLPAQVRATALAVGPTFGCAVTNEQRVMCWGSAPSGQLGRGAAVPGDVNPGPTIDFGAVTAVTAGYAHACALGASGDVTCWGGDTYGQLGRGGTDGGAAPGRVTFPADAAKIVQISAGAFFTCALDAAGAVWCWGVDGAGQCGTGATIAVPTPVRVPIAQAPAREVRAGINHACAIVSGGRVVCWGSNARWQLGSRTGDGGLGDPTPYPDPRPIDLP